MDINDSLKNEEAVCLPDIPQPPESVPYISLTCEEADKQGWSFTRKSGNRMRIVGSDGLEKNSIFPSEIGGRIVKDVDRSFFDYSGTVDSIAFPASIRIMPEDYYTYYYTNRNSPILHESAPDSPNISEMIAEHNLILSPDKTKENEFKVVYVSKGTKVKFPKGSIVSLEKGALRGECILDLSECAEITADRFVVMYRHYEDGAFWYSYVVKTCRIILPQGYQGLWFPKHCTVEYPDGTAYDGYITKETIDEDSAILTLNSNFLHYDSVTGSERNVTLRMSKANTTFEWNAIHSTHLEHLILEQPLSGEGDFFAPRCGRLHCVEWDDKTAYIPSADLIGETAHRLLLKAFGGRKDNTHRFFDHQIIDRAFMDKKQGGNLSQKSKILLAADVLRSTEALYPDRTPYLGYLQTHKRYALLLSKNLPQDYVDFLRKFYEAET